MQDPPNRPPPKHNEYEEFVQQIASFMLCEPVLFQQKLDKLRELYQPANVQEEYYLTQIAEGQLNVHRLGQLQAGLYNQFVQQALEGELGGLEAYPEPMRDESPILREQRVGVVLADSFIKNALKGNALALFLRFHTQAKRTLRHDQDQFDQIRKQQLKPPPKLEPEQPQDLPRRSGRPIAAPARRPAIP